MSPPSKSCEIDVRVTPRASKSRVIVVSGAIKVWVTAPPIDGQANDAVVETIAKALELPRSRIRIVKGHTSRQKRVAVEGLEAAEAMNRLGGNTLF